MKIGTIVLALWVLSFQARALEGWPSSFVRVEQLPPDLTTSDGKPITVLDARKRNVYLGGHIPGAQHAAWTRYRAGWFRSGRLPDDLDKLSRDLGKLGVDDDKPVLVCGSGQAGWGEEGRIAWMIRYLGHSAVAILDGGCDAWLEAGRPFSESVILPKAGTFTARPRDDLRALTSGVTAAISSDAIQLLDVRTEEEFDGATPYFASRGGHIPTAVNIPFLRFLNDRGQIMEQRSVEALLHGKGLRRDKRIIVYCTGGVRSAFVTEILRARSINAANYDASFWYWSADDDLPVSRHR